MDTLTLLLPVIWAVVSTAIGLILYRSSEAMFEASHLSDGGKKRIRLTGSVVIAALAFYGMKLATPQSRLEPLPPGAIVVSQDRFHSLLASAERTDRLSLELSGALEANDLAATHERFIALREETLGLATALRAVSGLATANPAGQGTLRDKAAQRPSTPR